MTVARRAVPAGLVVIAALADASGSPSLAFYALLALVPVVAVIALAAYGDVLEEDLSPAEQAPRSLQALLWGILVALGVVGAAARAPWLGEGTVPRLATTALLACVIVLCIEGIVELVALARKPAPRTRTTSRLSPGR